jgi:DeoR family transcriptional regulator, aga operon transcriptional repressor
VSSVLLSEERRRAILDLIHRQGRVLVTDLSNHFGISQVTIRKDLEQLHREHKVQRTHGGALVAINCGLQDLTQREKLNRPEKKHIAAAAARLVKEGEIIILNSSTTTRAIAALLRTFHKLTVITNSISIATDLSRTAVEVILIGGILRKSSFSLNGPISEATLHGLSADIAFLGVGGFDIDYGLTTDSSFEAQVSRTMLKIAKHTVVVCESSKFGHRSSAIIAPVSSIREVITDRGIPNTQLILLRRFCIQNTVV